MKSNKLQKQYQSICNQYIEEFCEKQEVSFEGWVADQVGGIAVCSFDFYFSFQDIVLDINSDQPKGAIIDWYHQNIENPEKSINYYSYSKGLRISDLM